MTDFKHSIALAQRRDRPFAFEDLPLNANGKRVEPESWGPIYSKPTKPTHLRDYDPPTNAPSGQKTAHVDDAKLRAKIKAEFAARCNAERKAWADASAYKGSPKRTAYEQAMAAKRAASEGGELAALLQAAAKRKPHYVLRAGEWRLAA